MREVIMPALGMAQTTGVIVSWLKAVGDPVSADDPLMEVETDKTVMEVPAGADGVVLEIRADAGAEVPVGDVIAVIGAPGAKPAAEKPATALPAKPSISEPVATTSVTAPPTPPPAAAASASLSDGAPEGRVLASPKARLLAANLGIDLSAHAAKSREKPLLAADVQALADRRAPAPAAAVAVAASPGPSHRTATLRAAVPAEAFADFVSWLAEETDRPIAGVAIVAAFAAAALRKATKRSEPIAVFTEDLDEDGASLAFVDPDRAGLASLSSAAVDVPAADLTILDLSRTSLTGADGLGDGGAPVVVLTDGGHSLDLALSFDPTALPPRAAAAVLADLARRMESPLRHLL